MTKLLDRLLVYSYVKAYLICLVSLLGLFIVIDLFNNLDNFLQNKQGLKSILQHIGTYYSYKVLEMFDLLCEPIVLLAAMFTVAWVQRNNELVPLLSAGVSTRRVVRPVLFSACLMLGLSSLNQELVLPHIDSYVLEHRDDWKGEKDIPVNRGFDGNGTLITGKTANRQEMLVRDFVCTLEDRVMHEYVNLQAKEARYIPPGDGPHTGGWELRGTRPQSPDGWSNHEILKMIVPGRFFLKTTVDFDTITRQKNWLRYLPTWQLLNELARTENHRPASVAVVFHMRLTRPVLGIILVFLGLSTILRDQNRNVYISAGLCLVLCAFFFVGCFACKYLGEKEFLSPALAAWMPVMTFGPLAFVMFDAVHT
jgi:lipopolysaccharide export system permease protein